MINGKKIVVVLPAYNAEQTLEQTVSEIDRSVVDEIILVDDCSRDGTKDQAKRLGLRTIVHQRNLGYGGNQKTCYQAALEVGADVTVMVHPDYQYSPKLIPSMAHMIATGLYDCVIGSRILGKGALAGGMPIYKYISNRALTFAQNVLMGQKLSEYHTGLRAFSSTILSTLPLGECDDDFVFDNEMLAQLLYRGFRLGEVSCPTKYFDEASSIGFVRSVKYGFGCLRVSGLYFLNRIGVLSSSLFAASGKKLLQSERRGVLYHRPVGSS